ncbi:MAG: phosphoribosylformylglycinamidine cyclo-ligase [Neisseriaceae bacterium]
MTSSITYKDSGVNIVAGDKLVERINPLAKKTMRKEVLAGIGGFGAMFEIAKKFKDPVLVSGTDGVGTKLKLAFELNIHDTIGIDLVAMSVNDILVQGAEPLFFLDYFACGKLNVDVAADVVKGISNGCLDSGCSLIGGETAEMPGMYADGEYDLAGFAVGAVDRANIITGDKLKVGDVVIGLESSGFHSNGYSLVRKLIKESGLNLNEEFMPGKTWGEAFLTPTLIYVKPVLDLISKCNVHAMSHITGGGVTGNLPRLFPDNLAAEINLDALPKTKLFSWAQEVSQLNNLEMLETFNCGIGYVVIVDKNDESLVSNVFKEHNLCTHVIGRIVERSNNQVIYI